MAGRLRNVIDRHYPMLYSIAVLCVCTVIILALLLIRQAAPLPDKNHTWFALAVIVIVLCAAGIVVSIVYLVSASMVGMYNAGRAWARRGADGLTIRLPLGAELVTRLDTAIAAEPDTAISRPEMIRRLLERALSRE